MKQKDYPISATKLEAKGIDKISTHELIIKFSDIREELILEILKGHFPDKI